MHAPKKPDIPVIKVDELTEPDGIMFGIPTRFGTMPAQLKAYVSIIYSANLVHAH